jgi:hypothetical protein
VNTDQKIIKNKVGLLNVANMLGSVSEAWGTRATVFTDSRNCTTREVSWR